MPILFYRYPVLPSLHEVVADGKLESTFQVGSKLASVHVELSFTSEIDTNLGKLFFKVQSIRLVTVVEVVIHLCGLHIYRSLHFIHLYVLPVHIQLSFRQPLLH